MNKDNITSWDCTDQLSKYTDSLLFDSGECLASMDWEDEKFKMSVGLMIRGDVRIWFKGDLYKYPTNFSEELRDIIKADDWDNPDLDICNNNWFEFIYEFTNKETGKNFTDGEVFEAIPADYTEESLKEEFLVFITSIIEWQKEK